MSWFPTFLNPWVALIAAGVTIPSLLLLYFLKLRRQERSVSSTLLWKKSIQDLQVNSPFQKLRKNLLLLLQLLLLAALLLALGRPVTNYVKGAGTITIVLIDRSASMSATDMDGNSRLSQAKERAKEVVGTLKKGTPAMVIAFDESAETVQPLTDDVTLLKRAIDSIQPTDRKSRLKLAYQLAEAQAFFEEQQLRATMEKPDVYLFSDGRVLDEGELSLSGQVWYEKIGTDTAPNIAIVALSARRNYERPTEVQVFARLANFGETPVKTDVELRVDGRVRSIGTATLLPDRWNDIDRIEKTDANLAKKWREAKEQADKSGIVARDSVGFPPFDLMTSAVIEVEQTNRKDDSLPADDRAYVVVPPPKNLKVLVVSAGNYFLEKALASMDLEKPDILTPANYEDKKPTDYDVIIFDRHTAKFLPPAGSFISMGAVPEGLKLKAVKQGDLNVMLANPEVLDWKRDHPILRPLQLGRLNIGQAIKMEVPKEAEVLVEGLSGPLIVLQREERGTHLIIGFDVLESDWPLKPSFMIFLQGAMQYLAIGSDMDVHQSYDPGATPKIPRTNLQQVDPTLKDIRLIGPDGTRKVTVPPQGDFALPALEHVGVYSTDPAIPQYEKIAVNLLDPNESNLLPASAPPGNVGDAIGGGAGKVRLELWRYIIAFFALPLLLVEWWVYTRRMHL
jgi:hypothetical protein